MADTLQFDLVSPERRLASATATEVRIPGMDGDMTAMADHAPLITTLRPGMVRVDGPDGASEYAVTGGFAEVTAESVTVLAERAFPRDAESRAAVQQMLDEARAAAREALGEHRDKADVFVSDLVDLLDAMA